MRYSVQHDAHVWLYCQNNKLKHLPEDFSTLMIEEFARDTVFHFGGLYKKRMSDGFGQCGNKSEVHSFNYRSMRRCKLYIRNVIDKCRVSVTLTYPNAYPSDGSIVKTHLKRFRERLRRRGISFFWVLEFQKRGAPHFHIVLDSFLDKEVLSRIWFECIGSTDEKSLRAGTRVELICDRAKIVNYFVSYLTKPEQKHVPDEYKNVGRFWGYTKKLIERKFHSFSGSVHDLYRLTRTVRRWYTSKLKEWGIAWKFGGRGFIAWDHGKTRGYNDEQESQKQLRCINACCATAG